MLRRIGLLSVLLLLMGATYTFASTIDLTSGGTVIASDGSIWSVVDNSPTGTGVYEPFLRLQARGTEAGLNTDGDANSTYNDVAGIWTHSLTFGDLGVVNVGGTNYYSFTWDVNEPANGTDEYISLDTLQIYEHSSPNAMTTGELDTLLYTFSDPPVLINYLLSSSGSGKDDIESLIPTSKVAFSDPAKYFYLYAEFGGVGVDDSKDFGSAAGYEEVRTFTAVPEPSTILLLGCGLMLIGIGLIWFKKRDRT